jgi:hypothetical protein
MARRKLLLFIQSNTVDVYVNAITHCVVHEDVKEVFFAGKATRVERESELESSVREIYRRLEILGLQHSVYSTAREYLPPDASIRDNICYVNYVVPDESLPELEKIFDREEVLIDVTGTQKELAADITVSFMANGFDHVCSFVLHDRVVSSEWNRSKLYHDLVDDDGVTCYTYFDFSESQSIVSSFNKMRARGKTVRLLLVISILLAISIIVLIALQRTNVAQIAAITTLVTIIVSLLESVVNFSKYLGQINKDR